jgi:hypothetical protein
MSQEANADIRNLFRKFGGESSNYQEIQQTYVVDKATQSWPIVEAMERSRPAMPTRKAVSKLVPASAQPAAPVIQPVAPMFQPAAPQVFVQPVAPQGGLSSLFAKPVAPPAAAPLRTLFGSFGTTPAAVDPHSVPVAQAPDTSLNAVFSRLLNPQKTAAASAPENNLRGLFGFLNK